MKKMFLLPLVLIMFSCNGKAGEPLSDKGEDTVFEYPASANREVAKEKEMPYYILWSQQ